MIYDRKITETKIWTLMEINHDAENTDFGFVIVIYCYCLAVFILCLYTRGCPSWFLKFTFSAMYVLVCTWRGEGCFEKCQQWLPSLGEVDYIITT